MNRRDTSLATASPESQGPPQRDQLKRAAWTPLYVVAALALSVGALLGYLFHPASKSDSLPKSSATLSVFNAETTANGHGLLIYKVGTEQNDNPTYDLRNVPWVAADGTVETGSPCTVDTTATQYVRLAVVEVGIVEGGPPNRLIAWYKCLGNRAP